MLKMLMGAVILVALVGYGVLDTNSIVSWGETMRQAVEQAITWAKEFKQ